LDKDIGLNVKLHKAVKAVALHMVLKASTGAEASYVINLMEKDGSKEN
jgi:hypothetical protein